MKTLKISLNSIDKVKAFVNEIVTHSIRHLFRRYIRETFQMSAGYFLPVSDF